MSLFDYMPYSKRAYLKHYNFHFNKPIYEWACSLMWKEVEGKEKPIKPIGKEELKEFLKKYSVEIPDDCLHDACYVYSAAMADCFGQGKSLPTEQMVALHIKDKINDVDKPDGYIFNQFLADCEFAGIPIDWEEFLD